MRAAANVLSSLEEAEGLSPAEAYRRIEVFLDALAALPKKSWRPRRDARGVIRLGAGLGRMRRLMERLGRPARGRTIIRVAGTSGKGSVALMIAESLRASGVRTAAFFSPHLTVLAERFWVDGRLLGAAPARRAARRLARAAAEMAEGDRLGPPSYFEAALGLLLLAAEEAGCEALVLEAGLGGSYDATNAVAPGALEVITSIGLDHTEVLGATLAQIARDKAGIITPGGRVLSGAGRGAARREIAATARARRAALHAPPVAGRLRHPGTGCVFDLTFPEGARWRDVRTAMGGPHQAANAALAAGAGRLLGLEERAVRAGLSAARLPGRFERMPGRPAVIIDGAHNRAKARALAEALRLVPARRRLILLGAFADKNGGRLVKELAPSGDVFFLTLPPGGGPRPPAPPEGLRRALRKEGAGDVRIESDPWAALDAALGAAGRDDLVVVAGSLYLAGELRRRWVPAERILEAGTPFPGDALR